MKGETAKAKIYVNVINGKMKITTTRGDRALIENKTNISVSGVRLRGPRKILRLIRSLRGDGGASFGPARLLMRSRIQAFLGRKSF